MDEGSASRRRCYCGGVSVTANIWEALAAGSFVFSDHADNMLAERGIPHWQIIQGMEQAEELGEYPQARPNPKAEFEILLPDGTPAKAVWSWLAISGVAKLVTVHFFDQ